MLPIATNNYSVTLYKYIKSVYINSRCKIFISRSRTIFSRQI